MNKLIEKIEKRIGAISELIRPIGWSKKIEVVETKAVLDIIHEEAKTYNELAKGDLISRQDVMEMLTNIELSCTVIPITEAKPQLKDIPSVQNACNDGWIPCSEHYPTTEEYILLSFTNFSVPVVGRWEEDKEGGAFYIGDDTESCVSQGLIVNAWQQLPPVYQPKGELI